jgi:tetratricopeptide (TPR) repeat protein
MGDKDQRIFLCLLIVFFIFCVLFAAQKIVSFDDWWHLKTGEWIWQHKAIPHVDPFSYTFRGEEWVDFEWLFQAVIYPIYQLGGFGGLITFKIIIILLTFMIIFFTCREVDKGRKWLSIITLFIALLIARGGFLVRPQIVSLLFLSLYLYLLALHRGERITSRHLILFLLPIHILWVNVHGSFLLGIFLVGAYAIGSFVPLALSHYRDLKPVLRDKRFQNFLLLGILLILASLVNPYTYRIFLIPLETARAQETLRGILEWVPSLDPRLLGVLTADPTMWFRALFLIGAISFFLVWRDNLKRIEDVLIFAVFSFMAFKYLRFIVPFALAAAPIIVNNLSQVRWRVRKWRWLRLVPLLIIIAFSINDMRTLIKRERLGFGVWRNYPETTVNFLKEHDVTGRIFNTYGYGGYLIWHLWPAIPVFIDGRTPIVYDEDFFWLYTSAYQQRVIWEKIVKRYGIEIVLLQDDRERGYLSLFSEMDDEENWKLVAFDDVSNLYLRKGGRFDGLIEQYGFRYLRPADVSMNYAKERSEDKKYLGALEKELNVACHRFPHDFYPFYYLGVYHQIYGAKEHFLDAEKAFRRAVANRPDLPRGYYELGFTLMKLEHYAEAVKTLKKAIKLKPDLPPDAYYYVGISLFQLRELDEAIRFLEKYKQRAGLETKAEAYRLLGSAYLQNYKFRKALSCFERVKYLEEPTWDIFTNMGISYFGLGILEKAQECFERAIEQKPNEIKVVYNLAIVYEKMGLTEKAKRLFAEASQMPPQTSEEQTWVQKAREKAK